MPDADSQPFSIISCQIHGHSQLLSLLDAQLRSDEPALEVAVAGTLGIIAAGSEQNRDAIVAAGVVPQLETSLRSRSGSRLRFRLRFRAGQVTCKR